MKIPNGMTEAQVIEIVTKAIKGLASKFKFGYFETEDMETEAWVYCLDTALEKYDISIGPLENYLRVGIRNHFINLQRNKLSRREPPCTKCPFFDPQCKKSTNKCSEFLDKLDCTKWTDWLKSNAAKSGLVRPLDIDSMVEDELPDDTEFINNINISSILQKINRELPVELRADFLKMLDGVYVSKVKKEKVREFIKKMGVMDELQDWQEK